MTSMTGTNAVLLDASTLPDDADDEASDSTEAVVSDAEGTNASGSAERRRPRVARVFVYGILPGLALLLAATAGYLKWVDSTVRDAELARAHSAQAAIDSTIAMLSYR